VDPNRNADRNCTIRKSVHNPIAAATNVSAVSIAMARPPDSTAIAHDQRNGEQTPPSPSKDQKTACLVAPAPPTLASQAIMNVIYAMVPTLNKQ
jgi:hypothetical protein